MLAAGTKQQHRSDVTVGIGLIHLDVNRIVFTTRTATVRTNQ